MENKITFTIDPNVLGGIGALLPEAKSSLSPLKYGGERSLNPSEKQALMKTGLLDARGQVTHNFKPTLGFLAQAKAYARVRLTTWDERLEQLHYFGAEEDRIVSITSHAEGILIQDPAPVREMMAVLRQNIGASLIASCILEAELPVDEALVLAALIDRHRKRILSAFIEGSKFEVGEYQPDDVLAELRDGIHSPDWLAAAIQTISGREGALSEGEIAQALNNLTRAGLLAMKGESYLLGEGALSVGKGLLVVDHILTLEAGELLDNEQIVTSELICMQSGRHSLLLLEYHAGVFHMRGISPLILLTLLEHFLLGSEILKNLGRRIAETQMEQAAKRGHYCTHCGQPVDADSKFCGECGAKVD